MTATRIAKELKIATSSVYYYYQTNFELRHACIQSAIEKEGVSFAELLPTGDSTNSGLEDLYNYLDYNLRFAFKHPHRIAFLSEDLLAKFYKRDIESIAIQRLNQGIKRIQGFLAMAIVEEEVSMSKNQMQDAAEVIHLILMGAAKRIAFFYLTESEVDQLAKNIRNQVNLLLGVHPL